MSHQRPNVLPHLRRFRLLDLPLDILHQILEIHFFGELLADVPLCFRQNPFKREHYGVLSVNQKLYKEAWNILERGAVIWLNEDYTRDAPSVSA